MPLLSHQPIGLRWGIVVTQLLGLYITLYTHGRMVAMETLGVGHCTLADETMFLFIICRYTTRGTDFPFQNKVFSVSRICQFRFAEEKKWKFCLVIFRPRKKKCKFCRFVYKVVIGKNFIKAHCTREKSYTVHLYYSDKVIAVAWYYLQGIRS